MTGVYFLLDNSVVVYIGQTCNLPQRLLGHRNKKYTDVRFIACAKERACYYEQRWIKLFKPKLNGIVGRPADKNPKRNVVAYIRQSVINKLRKIAEQDKRSISTMIEIAVEEKYI